MRHAEIEKNVLVVLDTNVIVSALLKPLSIPGDVLEKFYEKSATMVLSQEIYEEYLVVLSRRHFNWSFDIVARFQTFLNCDTQHLEPVPMHMDLIDEDDRPFIECAAMARCPIITGNIKHFAGLERYGVKVYTPAKFVESRL